MSERGKSWLRLIAGCAGIAAALCLLHLGTARLGGSPGRMIEENRSKDLEVYAYLYSEVGDLEEFLDDEAGRYGRASLSDALADGSAQAP